jgi:hypothetical protein
MSRGDAVSRRCPKARGRSGRKPKPRIPHAPHRWIAGVYLPIGETDGYWADCPGYPDPTGAPMPTDAMPTGASGPGA